MNEKFYKVTEKSHLYHHFWEYVENRKQVNELVKDFMKKHGIEAEGYAPLSDRLYIQPTKADVEKFDSVLNKPVEQGLRTFKKNSTIGKDWVNTLAEKELKVLRKPFVPMYFRNAFGQTFSRLFEAGGTVYCSLKSEFGEWETPAGMEEIKASEFYRIIEEYAEN